MNLERTQIVRCSLAGAFPSGEATQRTDVVYPKCHRLVAQCRDFSHEGFPHREVRQVILTHVQHHVAIVQHHEVHDRGTRAYQLPALRIDGGYLATRRSREPCIPKHGFHLVYGTLCGIHQRTGTLLVLLLGTCLGQQILLMRSPLGRYGYLIERLRLVVSLGTHHTVLVQGTDAPVGCLRQLKVGLALVPKLLGRTDDLQARTLVNLLVLILRHALHRTGLLKLGVCFRATDAHQGIASLYPLTLAHQEGIHASRQLARDADFGRLYLSLKHHPCATHSDDADERNHDNRHQTDDECLG